MGDNPFQVLSEEQGPTQRSPTPTPGKKKPKRKIDSPIAATIPVQIAGPRTMRRSTTGYLYMAKKAIQAALEAEKTALGEKYIEDNDIQQAYNGLEAILQKRPTEIEPGSLENLELQSQLDQMNAKIDVIAAEIKENGYKAPIPPSQAATQAAIGAT